MHIPLFAQAAESGCTLNGEPIDCGELIDKATPFIGLGIGILVIIGIIVLITFVFWVLILVHAVQHNSPDRTLWICILAGSFFLGFMLIAAIVYFFAEKKRAEQAPPLNPPYPTQPGVGPQQQQPPQPPQPPQSPTRQQ